MPATEAPVLERNWEVCEARTISSYKCEDCGKIIAAPSENPRRSAAGRRWQNPLTEDAAEPGLAKASAPPRRFFRCRPPAWRLRSGS